MPTIDLKVQTAGNAKSAGGNLIPRWDSLVGANEPHKCINDSATTTHDGDTTYLKLITPCLVSFNVFRMSEHWNVASTTMRAVIKAATPNLEIRWGMFRNDDADDVGFDPAWFVTGTYTDYTLLTQNVTLNPWTGLPFTAEELAHVEIGFFALYPVLAQHEVRLTLMSAQATYSEPIYGSRCQ